MTVLCWCTATWARLVVVPERVLDAWFHSFSLLNNADCCEGGEALSPTFTAVLLGLLELSLPCERTAAAVTWTLASGQSRLKGVWIPGFHSWLGCYSLCGSGESPIICLPLYLQRENHKTFPAVQKELKELAEMCFPIWNIGVGSCLLWQDCSLQLFVWSSAWFFVKPLMRKLRARDRNTVQLLRSFFSFFRFVYIFHECTK